jgi:hypothetical protein
MGQGIIAKTAETIVDAAMNTPTAMSYFIAQGLDVARDKQVDEGFLQQVGEQCVRCSCTLLRDRHNMLLFYESPCHHCCVMEPAMLKCQMTALQRKGQAGR